MASSVCLLFACLLGVPGLVLATEMSEEFQDISEVASPPWTSYRLPTDVKPTDYHILLFPNITRRTFDGVATINATVRAATNRVIFHAHNLKFRAANLQVHLAENPASPLPVVRQLTMTDHQMHYVELAVALPVGANISVSVVYTGTIQETPQGIFVEKYTVGNETREVLNSMMSFIYARRVFPCFDEPAFKAKFNFEIVREGKFISLSNAALKSTRPGSGFCEDCYVDVFGTSPLMSTYIVAVGIVDYKNISRYDKRGVLVSIWVPEDRLPQVEYALNKSVELMDYYADTFGDDNLYPLPKLDIVVMFQCKGAMENWGLIYQASILLYQTPNMCKFFRDYIPEILAREIVQQWLGNLVTCEWWDHLWVNEGPAQYWSFRGAAAVESEYLGDFRMMLFKRIFSEGESWGRNVSLNLNVSTPAEINSITENANVYYLKAFVILQAIEDHYGADAVLMAFIRLVSQHKWGNVSPRDFWTAFIEEHDVQEPLLDYMQTWETTPGYPLFTVTRQPSGVLNITQAPFLMYNYDLPPPARIWAFPFAIRHSASYPSHEPVETFITQQNQAYNVPRVAVTGYVKGNVGGIGPYRVNYDAENWGFLGQQLERDFTVFNSRERVEMIDDAFTLASVGKLDYSLAFGLLNYLPRETQAHVWQIAFRRLDYIKRQLALEGEFYLIHSYIQGLANGTLDAIGWEERSGDTANRKILRKMLLKKVKKATPLASDYLEQVQGQFAEWKRNTTVEEDFNPSYITVLYLQSISGKAQVPYPKLQEKYPGLLVNGNLKYDKSERAILLNHQWQTTQMSSVKQWLWEGDWMNSPQQDTGPSNSV